MTTLRAKLKTKLSRTGVPSSTQAAVENLGDRETTSQETEPHTRVRPRFSKRRLAFAFGVAALFDGLSIFLALTPPVQWGADVAAAILLFMVLGFQWVLLPGLILEAIPGLNVLPFWVLVVGAAAMWGTVRPDRKLLASFGIGASHRASAAGSDDQQSMRRGLHPGKGADRE